MNKMTSIESESETQTDVVAEAPKRDLKRWMLMLSMPLLLLAIGGYFWATGGRSPPGSP